MTTELTTTPIVYYPNNPARNVFRIEMTANGAQIAWADLFIEENWAHFVYVYVQPEHRSEETIMDFIRGAFDLDLGTKNIYWFGISATVANFYHQIVAERPDLTFAATGAVNMVSYANNP